MTVTFTVSGERAGAFLDAFRAKEKVIARACTAGMRRAGAFVKEAAAADIAAAGFSRRWQQGVTARVYPEGRESINAAVFAAHKIPYANVFEEGAQIRGKPLLWLPLPSAAQFVGFGRKATPALFAARGLKLISINRAGERPLLAVRMTGPTIGARVQPVFVGVPLVNITGRFHFHRVCEQALGRLPGWIESEIRDE